MLRSLARSVRTALREVDNRARRARFARTVLAPGQAPAGTVGVFFAGGPDTLYQLADWLPSLELLAQTRPVVLVVTRPDAGRRLAGQTALPIVFAPGSPALESLVRDRALAAVLYVNHLERNFRMLRFPEPVHIYLGHGESDKDSSVSNQNKAYDYSFVAGPAAQERLASHLRGYDAVSRAPMIGRPQLDSPAAGAPPWPQDGTTRVLYAPTWEGDRAAMAYGSLASHGEALVASLAAHPNMRVVYRPHPRTGARLPSHARADARVRQILARGRGRHLVDQGSYGWQWAFADVCITDVSSVAYDWLATGKPLLVTRPEQPQAFLPPSRLLDSAPLLSAADASRAAELVEGLVSHPPADWDDLVRHYFGDTSPGASTRRFHAALDSAIAEAQAPGYRAVPPA